MNALNQHKGKIKGKKLRSHGSQAKTACHVIAGKAEEGNWMLNRDFEPL